MTRAIVDTATIPGWGVDADPDNDPTFPMRHVEDQHSRGLNWVRPAEQRTDVEILQSIEHDRRPAVVGTATPPSGLSGAIRRVAFRRSESDWWHWLLLMGADRINMVEGVVQDLARGTVPNIPAEMGIRAEWRHNKRGLATKLGVAATASAALYLLLRRRPAAPPVATIGNGRMTTIRETETTLGQDLDHAGLGRGHAGAGEDVVPGTGSSF
ncbi:MAG TPA: hypothetical protein VF649_15060 [Sphingomonas sp.]|jgi:hypothetical protein|uniref:hypothetical protein n=1 Tax=Sphingomonas sp. TaxID=28214 RepID=UPI002ED781D2